MVLDVEQLLDSEELQPVTSLDKITGYIGFTEAEDGTMSTEYLRSIQVKLYDSNNTLIKDSGEVICNNAAEDHIANIILPCSHFCSTCLV